MMKVVLFIILIISFNSFSAQLESGETITVEQVSEEELKEQEKLKEDAKSLAAEILPNPTREFAIILNKEGYYPKKISAFVGEKLRLFVTNLTDEASCVVLSQHNLFLAAQKGTISEGEVTLDRPGIYPFYCPTSKFNGQLVVIQKKKKVIERKIASEEVKRKDGPWMPKEK